MGFETLALMATTGASSGYLADRFKARSDEAGARTKAQLDLENQRKAQLAKEQSDRAAAKAKAETRGTSAGRGALLFPTGAAPGFGTGNTPSGPGRGMLFGN